MRVWEWFQPGLPNTPSEDAAPQPTDTEPEPGRIVRSPAVDASTPIATAPPFSLTGTSARPVRARPIPADPRTISSRNDVKLLPGPIDGSDVPRTCHQNSSACHRVAPVRVP